MYNAPGFEPAKKQFEPPQKGGRQYAGLRQQILPGGAAILLGVPENQNRRMVVFILCALPQDLNLRKSSSNRSKKADDSTPVVRTHNFARWRSNPAGRARKLKPPYGGFYFMCPQVCQKKSPKWAIFFNLRPVFSTAVFQYTYTHPRRHTATVSSPDSIP